MHKRIPSGPGANILIERLAPSDRALVQPHLDVVEMTQGFVLEEANVAPSHVYFPLYGVASVVALADDGRRIEAGLFGYEGMSAIGAITTGLSSPNTIFMQIAGIGLRMETERLAALQRAHWSLHAHFMRYIHSIIIQLSQTALSNGHAKLEERLARWILMCHDRVSGDTLELTHEFLAIMLGVRRAGVTVATHLLEGKGLIRAERGRITVVDRLGLEGEAKKSYGVAEAEYIRLMALP